MNIIETVDITKKYGDFTANNAINLAVQEGEIKAIVGENGAGKTTLMNMLYGLISPTSGKILVKGKEVCFSSPLDAINAGLGMVHQHFKLVPSLTICENILLGIEILKSGKLGKTPFIDMKKEFESVQEVVDKFKFDLNVRDKVENISIGQRQRVEIMKMLYRNVDILILDEPTAVLTPQEVDDLIVNLKELKAQGKTIIVITHKLGEVMELSDSVTIIKRGKVVGEVKTKDTTEKELAQMMVGRDVVLSVQKEAEDNSDKEVIYKLENVSTKNITGKEVLSDINLEVHKGEILGIAGVEGNGQSELLKVLTGIMTTTKGKVSLKDKDITNWWPADIRSAGVGMIHEDRYAQGLCREMSINENIIAGYHNNTDVCRHGFLNFGSISKKRDRLVKDYDIRVADPEGEVSQMSGGNAQKLIIAREFDSNPQVLIACQPTRGVDVGSIEFIHNKIIELSRQGVGILLISSELSEIMSLSDRIAVMYKGKIIGIVNAKDASTTQIGLLMAGITDKGEKVS
jgi:simple sugar transport system ATP-binding protein